MRPPPFLRPLTAELLVSAPPWADGCMTEDDLLLTWLPKLGLAKDHHLPHMSHIKVEDVVGKRMVAEAFLKKRKNSAVRPPLRAPGTRAPPSHPFARLLPAPHATSCALPFRATRSTCRARAR